MDGKSFTNANEFGVIQTQAVYHYGQDKFGFVGFVNSNDGAGVTKNGGVTFSNHFWPKNFSSYQAGARYGAFVNDNVWYVTGG